MKALELIVYPFDPTFPRGYKLPRDIRVTIRAADRMAREKRFTTTELAAEHWRAEYRVLCLRRAPNADKFVYEADIIDRFATLPHYDEVSH